jgi:hypothetical protein
MENEGKKEKRVGGEKTCLGLADPSVPLDFRDTLAAEGLEVLLVVLHTYIKFTPNVDFPR